MALSNLDFSFIIGYAVICLIIGFWSSRKQSHENYLIADRKLKTFSFVFTVVASYIGGGALVAYTAYVYRYGISTVMIYIGTALGYLLFIWYALKIRRIGKEKNFHSLPDWLANSYGKKVGLWASVIILIVYLGILANQFIAGSSVLSSISGWSYESCLIFAGIVILIYLSLGGFSSVVKTDVFQYIVMLVLFSVIGFVMLSGGNDVPIELLSFSNLPISLGIAALLYGIFSIFTGMEYWQRVYAAESDDVVRKGLKWSAFFVVLTGLILTLIGLSAAANFPDIDSNQAAAYGMQHLLPSGLLGLGLVMLFAAIMSSADTLIFVLASTTSKALHDKFFIEFSKSKRVYLLTRNFIFVFTILGVIIAFFFRDIISVLLTMAGVGLSLIPSIFGSFHWKLKNGAVLASYFAGIIYTIGLILFGYLIPELAIASVIVSFITLGIFQLILKE